MLYVQVDLKSQETQQTLYAPSTQQYTNITSFFHQFVYCIRYIFSKLSCFEASLTVTPQREQGKQSRKLNREESTPQVASQEKFILTSVLALPMKEGHYTLDTDACNRRIGQLLPKKQGENFDRKILFPSEVLNDRRRTLGITY